MKQKRDFSMLYAALAGFLLFCSPLFLLLLGMFLSEWSARIPSSISMSFPEGTQITEQADTHQGFFRQKGTSIVVAQIPAEHAHAFGEQLRSEEFIVFPPLDHVQEILKTTDAAAPFLDDKHVLWFYRDEALAFVEEPFSDYFAATYDEETGLYCGVEYDS